jgi:hypothetical protein
MEPRTEVHEVNGREVVFHEVSVGMFSKLRTVATLSTDAIMQLMRNPREDAGSQTSFNQEGDQRISKDETHLSVSPELARHHEEKRTAAIHQLGEALMGQTNQQLLSEFIADSLRLDGVTGKSLLEDCGAGVFVECLLGALKANAGVFGPFSGAVRQMLNVKIDDAAIADLAETLKQSMNSTTSPGEPSLTVLPTLPEEEATPVT